jgi:hypothetical protein
MTNIEKLRECFPNTIFIYRKEDDRTTALMCSDEWLESEYKAPDNRKCEACKHHVIMVEVGDGKPPRHTSGCELWECKFEPKEPIIDKIRAEILEEHENAYAREDYDTAYGLSVALDIIDKYKAESEKA